MTLLLSLLLAGAQLPPSTPPPPPNGIPPPHVVMLFFEGADEALTERHRLSLRIVFDRLQLGEVDALVVEGHSDTAPSPDQRRSLSCRRAHLVRDYLIRAGVQAGSISTHCLGADRMLVPTGEGVSEPQNRRVDIWMRRSESPER